METIEVIVVPSAVFEAFVRVLDAARLLLVPEDDNITEEEILERFNHLQETVDFADKVIDFSEISEALRRELVIADSISGMERES